MAMATDRRVRFAIPAAASLLLWPALWNGYPIVFADTGTYLSQALHRYAGWDRPVFYSIFMAALHWGVTVWPVGVAQALIAAWVLWLCWRWAGGSAPWFVAVVAVMAVTTWLPWLTSELMPDFLTPLLILAVGLLAFAPLAKWERAALVGLATFAVAAQLSSVPLALGLVLFGAFSPSWPGLPRPSAPGPLHNDRPPSVADPKRNRLASLFAPSALAIVALCLANLTAHGRFSIAPFGSVFQLARVIYDGPGLDTLRKDCPSAHWHLCPYLATFPPESDDFLWDPDSPLNRAGGPKLIAPEASAIVARTLATHPFKEAQAAFANTTQQMLQFASGDGLNPWPAQVSHWLQSDFPAREFASYQSARQQSGHLFVPLGRIHPIFAAIGLTICLTRIRRADPSFSAFILLIGSGLVLNAAICGALSGPHDRYQARVMWLPPFVAVLALKRRLS